MIRDNPWGTLIGADSVHTITIIDDETNSIDDIGLSSLIKLYPNPVKNSFKIEGDVFIETLSIYDILGQKIKSFTNINTFDIDDLASGTYILEIISNKGTAKTKNIKETRKDIVSKSFHEAVSDLQKQLGNTISDWKWGEIHTVEHEHPLGKVAALRGLFNVGPFASPGSNEVINNFKSF